LVGVERRIEIWRKGKLIDLDVKMIEAKDMVVNAGLDGLCGAAFDVSGSRPAVFNSIAIGTGANNTLAADTTLQTEVMRIKGTYIKTTTGACTVAGSFAITSTYALTECGMLNDPSGGTLYCRDTYVVKNVLSGDTVNVTYTPSFAAV
jgi:hypothetical protein